MRLSENGNIVFAQFLLFGSQTEKQKDEKTWASFFFFKRGKENYEEEKAKMLPLTGGVDIAKMGTKMCICNRF